MPQTLHDCTPLEPIRPATRTAPATPHRKVILDRGLTALAALILASTICASTAVAQDWSDPEDDWSTPDPAGSGGIAASGYAPSSGWSLKAGIGFTVDPDQFLMNFEVPYHFDQYVSVGPMIQVGLADHRSTVAPTANLTLTIPDLPGNSLDRFRPNLFAGIGFAVIENKDRGGDNQSAGFLVNAGFGIDYVVSERLSIGSRMIFNFLPERTLDEKFFYSWELGGIRVSF